MTNADAEGSGAPRPLRILYARNLFRPVDFGGNRYAVELTTRLAARGHEVVVVTGTLQSVDPAWAAVRIVQYRRSLRHPLLTFTTNAAASRLAILRTMRGWTPDVVVHSSWDCGYGYFRFWPPKSVPTVYIYHSSFYSEAVRALGGRRGLGRVQEAINRFLGRVEALVLGSASKIVAVSPFSRSQIETRLGRGALDKCEVVSTGVDTDLFSPGDKDAARRALGLSPDALVLAVVGRLTVVKRYDRAIRALAALRADGRAATLLVIGDGPELGPLRELAHSLGVADHVRFEGFVDGSDLVARLRAADFQLCTSEFENWSLAIMEGLACGTPVIGTPFGGTPQLLGSVDPGLVLPDGSDGSAQDFVAAIRALEQRADHRDLAGRCRTFAMGFGWDSVVRNIESTLRSAADTHVAR